MNLRRLLTLFALVTFVFAISISPVFAQSPDPTPSPTVSPTPSPSPSPSATPTPNPTPQATPTTASPSPNLSAGGTDGSVLGETTTLGETDSGKELAKWAIAVLGGLFTFFIAVKIVRNDTQE